MSSKRIVHLPFEHGHWSYFDQQEMNNKYETICDILVQNNTRWTCVALVRLDEIDQLQYHRLVR